MIKPQSYYRHYKDKPYRALGIAHHSETQEELVLYEALYPNDLGPLWVRPRAMFEEKLPDGVTDRFRLDIEANRGNPAQRQLDAYNARNLEEFLACYTEDVIIENGTTGTLISQGKAAMAKTYGPMFAAHPNLHCTVTKRIELGNTIIDEELVVGHPRGDGIKVIAIYDIKDGLISRVRFIS